jgi:hypothetical protein
MVWHRGQSPRSGPISLTGSDLTSSKGDRASLSHRARRTASRSWPPCAPDELCGQPHPAGSDGHITLWLFSCAGQTDNGDGVASRTAGPPTYDPGSDLAVHLARPRRRRRSPRRHGTITAQHARQLAADPTGSWRGLVTDTTCTQLLDYGTTYRPPQPLIDFIALRDGICAFPHCYQPPAGRTAPARRTAPLEEPPPLEEPAPH